MGIKDKSIHIQKTIPFEVSFKKFNLKLACEFIPCKMKLN